MLFAVAWTGVAGAIAYEAAIEGVPQATLRALLERHSRTLQPEATPPATLIQLRRRAEDDRAQFIKALHSEGYYAAYVELSMDTGAAPVAVRFHVEPGPQYRFTHVNIGPAESAAVPPDLRWPTPDDAGFTLDGPARTRQILDADGRLLRFLRNQGCPYPQIIERPVVVDHDTHAVEVQYRVDPGPRAVLGPVQFEGLETVQEAYVLRKLPWRRGDLFDPALIDAAPRKLLDTGLFSVVRVEPAPEVDAGGELPITLRVTERKHRSIAAGAQYRTDEGVGLRARWEHRNLGGLGRRLTLTGRWADNLQGIETVYRMPETWRDDVSLALRLDLANEEIDAYDSTFALLEGLFDRRISETLTAGAGFALRVARVEQQRATTNHAVLSFPGFLVYDSTTAPLDPASGYRAHLQLQPSVDLRDPSVAYLRSEANLSAYRPVGGDDRTVLAARLKLGSISGAALSEVPAPERFYAGGGGSIRGYAYKSVSPLADDVPLGGRSLFEVSFELRQRLSEQFGAVVFVDGGSAFESAFPDFGEDIRWGAGAGLRYFTPIGPLRLDLGIPLNRRKSLDPQVGVYISFGQSF